MRGPLVKKIVGKTAKGHVKYSTRLAKTTVLKGTVKKVAPKKITVTTKVGSTGNIVSKIKGLAIGITITITGAQKSALSVVADSLA